MSDQSPIQSIKDDKVIRLVTFNVNGIRTLFHYQPFSGMNQSLEEVFEYFNADIITFQEMKTDRHSITRWGKVEGYYSFVSIPQARKGYSGVGCWVRILPKDHPLSGALKVVKAEEGITGLLTIKSGKTAVRYRDDPTLGIGGYDSLGLDDESDVEVAKLDSEGRCVMIELACNVVVICVYCPANSGLSDEGASFRIKFLKVLFRRIRNLDEMGKRVVLMGDINVCRDLIDHAEALEQGSISIINDMSGREVEQNFKDQCAQFIINPDAPHRRMLNQMLTDSIIPDYARNGILVDSTRLIQSRNRLKMYTVWSTLKNSRPVNYGSRIDFILTSASMGKLIRAADILPAVTGSDHCPVYADIDLQEFLTAGDLHLHPSEARIPKFEARYKFGLTNRNVLEMFGKKQDARTTKEDTHDYRVTKKIPRQRVKSAGSYEIKNMPDLLENDINETLSPSKDITKMDSSTRRKNKTAIKDIFGKPPLCKHGLNAIQRTSKTSANPGKKFWICKLPRGAPNDESSSCGFFQWA